MDDLISRQAAIDAVHKSIFDFFDICDDDEESPMTYEDEKLLEINKAITLRIKQLPSAQTEPQWIPVSERLPEEGKMVLISDDGNIDFGMYEKDGWLWLFESGTSYWASIEKVDAWMTLPAPWRGEGHGE